MKDLFKGVAGQLQGKLKEQFGNLSEEDLAQAQSDPQGFITKMKEKLGGSKEDIAQRLSSLGIPVPGAAEGAPSASVAEEAESEESESEKPA